MAQIDSRPDTLHVFAVDATMERAEALAADGAALSAALGGIEVEPDRAHVIDTRPLGDLGLSTFLVEGEAADADAVRPDAARLDARRGPVLILRTGAVRQAITASAPLSHLGSYPMAGTTPVGPPIRTGSAEGTASGTPAGTADPAAARRRSSGLVAMLALVAALLVVVIVFLVAI
ncbi:hypothetical protein [Palleronia rufa]|uniref:hypothetical protein n=1 Tax=Palleronia rufa TaxID=1530186 RepID=UPI00055F7749|nr:hypothetical protein [Palleronia rufa]